MMESAIVDLYQFGGVEIECCPLDRQFDRHQRSSRQFRHSWANQQEVVMPIDSILVSAVVVTMFTIFAGVLAWGGRQSRPLRDEPGGNRTKHRSF
jgi:hypothetical protein